jgi:RND family efflux transporter MFP subunit
VLICITLICSGIAAADQRATLVHVDDSRFELIREVENVVGHLVPRQAGYVATRIEGPIDAIHVEVGDEVIKGQKIATIDAEILRIRMALRDARVSEAKANLAIRRSELSRVRQEKNRLQKLKSSAATSLAQHDDAVQRELTASAREKEAKVRVNIAQSELQLAAINLRYAIVNAPYDGVIAERLAETGEYVKRGQRLLRLVSYRQLELEANVGYNQAIALVPNTPVPFRLEGGALHHATVRAVVPEENSRTRTRRVRFTLDPGTPYSNLAANQSVILTLPVGPPQEAVTVNKDALVHKGGKILVYVVRDNKALPRRVTLGISSGSRIAITQGLQANEAVIIRGNERIRPGQAVKTAKPTS